MKRLKIVGIICVLSIVAASAATVLMESWTSQDTKEESGVEAMARQKAYETTAKRDLLSLMLAYGEEIKGIEREDDGMVYVVMQSGKRIVYDDKKEKTFEQKLADADIQDMMEQVYPLAGINRLMEENLDPGRIRAYDFFHEVYGKTEDEIKENLKSIVLGGQYFSFNKNNNAAGALEGVFDDLAALTQESPGIRGFVYPLGGTYNYRVIAGTGRLSPHAFGIAVDLKSSSGDYWRWATKEQGQRRLDAYPRDLVRVFENNYFIWGGKWSHFDILHYEYRPELIIKSKYGAQSGGEIEPWYSGFPDTAPVHSCIDQIERAWEAP